MSAIAISNQVDCVHRENREKRYLEIIRLYDQRRQKLFPMMLFHLVEGLEEKVQTTGPEDILGVIFHELELHNKYKAQFFTPSDMMASITLGDSEQSNLGERGFIAI